MKKSLALVLVLAMMLSVFAACGGKETAPAAPAEAAPAETDTSTDAAPAEDTKPQTEEVTLNVAYMPNYASLVEIVTAVKAGYMEDENIKVNLVEFADGPTIIAAMESGSIDVGYIGPGAHKLCINGRAKVFSMCHLGNADAVIGLKSKGVSTPADLKGKTVAYAAGTASETILKWALESADLTMDDIVAMEMDASAIVTAMNSGSIDACATWSPNTFTILAENGDDAVVVANNLDFADQSASIASWIVLSDYAEKNEDTLVRFTRALFNAKDYRANPDNYEEISQWIAEVAALDFDTVYNQRGDGEWLTSEELVGEINNGTMKKLYESQQKGFIESGDVAEPVPVEDYVLFDIMLKAAEAK